ncbi:MAG: hypothetical protein Q9172_004777 [Xanthocarpia lactea]
MARLPMKCIAQIATAPIETAAASSKYLIIVSHMPGVPSRPGLGYMVEELKGSPAADKAHKVREDNVPSIELMAHDIPPHELQMHVWTTTQLMAKDGCFELR